MEVKKFERLRCAVINEQNAQDNLSKCEMERINAERDLLDSDIDTGKYVYEGYLFDVTNSDVPELSHKKTVVVSPVQFLDDDIEADE